MKNLRNRNRFAQEINEDDMTIEELEYQLSDELDVDEDDVDMSEMTQLESDDLVKEANELLAAFENSEKVTEAEDQDDEVAEVIKACKELEEKITAAEKEFEAEDQDDEVAEVIKACKELEEKITAAEKEFEVEDKDDEVAEVIKACEELEEKVTATEEPNLPDEESIVASETTPGIEDEIGDEAKGGDPSVSDLVDTKVDVSTDKEVYPTNSEYVASITKRLDRVATILEKRGMKRMAFRVDQLSDKLESSICK